MFQHIAVLPTCKGLMRITIYISKVVGSQSKQILYLRLIFKVRKLVKLLMVLGPTFIA